MSAQTPLVNPTARKAAEMVRFKVGYEAGTLEDVYIDIPSGVAGHMLLVGQTGCGKTTSLEAFVAQLKEQKTIIVFRTDRNEVGFEGAISIEPYFGLPEDGITAKFLQSGVEVHTGS